VLVEALAVVGDQVDHVRSNWPRARGVEQTAEVAIGVGDLGVVERFELPRAA
jgi:hypothetical protein